MEEHFKDQACFPVYEDLPLGGQALEFQSFAL